MSAQVYNSYLHLFRRWLSGLLLIARPIETINQIQIETYSQHHLFPSERSFRQLGLAFARRFLFARRIGLRDVFFWRRVSFGDVFLLATCFFWRRFLLATCFFWRRFLLATFSFGACGFVLARVVLFWRMTWP